MCLTLSTSFLLLTVTSIDAAPLGDDLPNDDIDVERPLNYVTYMPLVMLSASSVTTDVPPPIVTEPDGTVVTVGLMLMPEEFIDRAQMEGLITAEEAIEIREEQADLAVSSADLSTCTWGNDWYNAVLRGSGRNSDNDFFEDYEQPEGTQYGYCVTPFYWGTKGWPNSFTEPPHYGPNLFRRRMIIGLSGFPDWFAAAQASLILHN